MTPEIILNYKILSVLGEGGMGIVYLAQHSTLERKVAIKVLHPQYAQNPLVKERFINEAKILSKLNHSNIVILYDFADKDDNLYLIMEFVEGVPLDDVIQKSSQPLAEAKAVQIFNQILNAFDYAHNQGVIHRDIKPSNIILKDDLTPKILDFGIAKIVQTEHRLTKTGTRMGSVVYMSPEQIMGHDVDRRTDIYSLGVTMYEIFTRFNPFDSPTDSEYTIQNKILTQPLPPVRQYNSSISERMENIILKATAKNPDLRFGSCREFAQALNIESYQYSAPPHDFNKTKPFVSTATTQFNGSVSPDFGYNIPQKKKSSAMYFLYAVLFLIFIAVGIIIYLVISKSDNDSENNKSIKSKDTVNITSNENTTNNTNTSANTKPKTNNSQSVTQTPAPEQRVKDFINSLGSRDFLTAYNIYKGWSGNYDKFKSPGAFGCVSYTNIYDCYLESSDYSTASVYADYQANDPCNKSGRYQIRFNMYKVGEEWFIKKYQVLNKNTN